jgi:hypothetical protein
MPGPPAAAGHAHKAAAETQGVGETPEHAASSRSSGLLGLTPMYQIQDVGDSRLTPREEEDLRRQLEAHPPEVALFSDHPAPADICRLCWSIVYRPLTDPENL